MVKLRRFPSHPDVLIGGDGGRPGASLALVEDRVCRVFVLLPGRDLPTMNWLITTRLAAVFASAEAGRRDSASSSSKPSAGRRPVLAEQRVHLVDPLERWALGLLVDPLAWPNSCVPAGSAAAGAMFDPFRPLSAAVARDKFARLTGTR